MVAKVNLHIGGHSKPFMLCQFGASIPGQGFTHLIGQLLYLPGESVNNAGCIFARHLNQQHEAGLAFDQGR